MGLCLLVGVEDLQPCDCSPLLMEYVSGCRRLQWSPRCLIFAMTSGRENYSHFADGCWVTGFFGSSVNHNTAVFSLCPFHSFLVEFPLIRLQERFMVLKPQPLAPQSSHPNLLSSP